MPSHPFPARRDLQQISGNSLIARSSPTPHTTTTMTRLRSPVGLSNAVAYLLLALFALPSQALYFYMKDGTPKCFHEELPKDTLVVGMSTLLC
jgi:hypothetical protein